MADDNCPKCGLPLLSSKVKPATIAELTKGKSQTFRVPDEPICMGTGTEPCLRRQLKVAKAENGQLKAVLADVRARLRGMPESKLDGDGGLAAATMRENDRLKAIVDRYAPKQRCSKCRWPIDADGTCKCVRKPAEAKETGDGR